ncbi:hypothetical protein M0811_11324 [Anaeramoeba ignava]|uniref:Uncharacterized protein n=1 Tax=Anaeramoeba ignava TaxID=1746090 RepID=A0A9Q0R8Q8_ANAIG|nr:hypothetical protein M0811_11324 [Anaeramoeba ignava]
MEYLCDKTNNFSTFPNPPYSIHCLMFQSIIQIHIVLSLSTYFNNQKVNLETGKIEEELNFECGKVVLHHIYIFQKSIFWKFNSCFYADGLEVNVTVKNSWFSKSFSISFQKCFSNDTFTIWKDLASAMVVA